VSEPRQFRKDPATGRLVEDVAWANGHDLACRCDACPCGSVRVDVSDDDESEPDAPTDLELSGTAAEHPELPPVSDPPGGSD